MDTPKRIKAGEMLPRRIGGAVVLASFVALLSCSSPDAPGNEAEQRSAAQSLPSLFVAADACLKSCSLARRPREGGSQYALADYFRDLLKDRRYRDSFDELIGRFPTQFAGIAKLNADDRADLEFEGHSVASLTTLEGRALQIYFNVGYPEKQWVNWNAFRRPEGILHVIVDTKSGEMAGIFNGPDDLSQFSFHGEEALLAPLLAYIVAEDVHSDGQIAQGTFLHGPALRLPLTQVELPAAQSRLNYLAHLYEDGQINHAQTLADIREATDDAAGRNWYTPNSSHTQCLLTGGPAEKLEEFEGFIDRPTTNDFTDADGNLTKVEVLNDEGYGTTRVWTYYRHRTDCEAEWVTRTEDLADRYR